MPVYDNNGTTSYEIGKVYDNNNTTSYEVGTVYDNNGTTDYEIWSADLAIIPNQTDYPSANWTKVGCAVSISTTSTSRITLYASNYGTAYGYVAVDTSGYTTLKIVGTVSTDTSTFGYYNNIWTMGLFNSVAELTIDGHSYATYGTSGWMGSGETKDINASYDISGVNKTMYFAFRSQIITDPDPYRWYADLTSVILE